MTTRIVEGKKPYTGGTAIEIDENKVISLRLRDENNLIIYDAGDNEIYVDLQLPDGIRPLDAFPVGVTTGRVLVADDWDKTGTIICAKTTSGDNIKVLYADDGTLWIDNGTGTFKQIYFKADVDAIIATLTAYINAELAKKQNGVVSATAPESPAQGDLWYDTTSNSMKVYDGTAWQSVGGGSDIVYATQAEYNALLPGALTDGKHYFIYTSDSPTPPTPSGWDFSNWTLSQTSNGLGQIWCGGIFFNNDGTKLYVSSAGAGKVYEVSLGTAYDVSSVTLGNTYVTYNSPEDIHFSPDGQNMYIYGGWNPLRRYSLSTAWDITTASQQESVNIGDVRGFFITDDGTKLFVPSQTGDSIKQYTMSTAWNLSTLSSPTTITTSYGGIGIRFSPDGKTFVTQNDESTSDLTWVKMSTPYDFTTITDTGTETIGKLIAGGLWFNNDGTICAMVGGGTSTNNVTKYTL